MKMLNQGTGVQAVTSNWKSLYRVAGAAALISALFIPIQIIVFMVSQPPFQGTVSDWFMLLQNGKFFGLVDLDILLVADNVLLIPIFLALYILLRRGNESAMLIATALGFASIIFFIATNPAIEMLSLSEKYATAATDAEKGILIAAGQTLLATWQGTAFQVGYLAGSVAAIVIGVVMLRSSIFSKLTAYLAILSNAVGLGLYIPVVGVYIAVFSVFFLEVWYVLIARRLFQLGRGASHERRMSQVIPSASS